MAVAVTDFHVATLRALLLQDWDENKRLMSALDEEDVKRGYLPLVTGAFMQATKERFKGKTQRDIVQWVADVRATRDENVEFDPNVAEKLLLWVFGKKTTEGIDTDTNLGHQTMLLLSLLEEADLDNHGVDEFLDRARTFTDNMLKAGGSA